MLRQTVTQEPRAVTALRTRPLRDGGCGPGQSPKRGGTVTKLTRQTAAARRVGRAGVRGAQRPICAAGPVGAHRRRSEQPSPARPSVPLAQRGPTPPRRWRRLPYTRAERLSPGGGATAASSSRAGSARQSHLGGCARHAHRGPRTAASASLKVSAGWTQPRHCCAPGIVCSGLHPDG